MNSHNTLNSLYPFDVEILEILQLLYKSVMPYLLLTVLSSAFYVICKAGHVTFSYVFAASAALGSSSIAEVPKQQEHEWSILIFL